MSDTATAGMESEPIASPRGLSGHSEAIPADGCPVKDGVGRGCELPVGHEGGHQVAMEPMELVYRQAVQACVVRRDVTVRRSALLSAREVKLDLVLDNQAAILNGLAMVLDMGLRGAGLPGQMHVVPEKGDGRA